jgi:excisionase family DNA binding protein
MDDLITPAEAARVRNVTRSAITDLLKRGRLQSVEVGGRRFLRRKEVENFAPEITGRPPKSSATGDRRTTVHIRAANGTSTSKSGKKKSGKK